MNEQLKEAILLTAKYATSNIEQFEEIKSILNEPEFHHHIVDGVCVRCKRPFQDAFDVKCFEPEEPSLTEKLEAIEKSDYAISIRKYSDSPEIYWEAGSKSRGDTYTIQDAITQLYNSITKK